MLIGSSQQGHYDEELPFKILLSPSCRALVLSKQALLVKTIQKFTSTVCESLCIACSIPIPVATGLCTSRVCVCPCSIGRPKHARVMTGGLEGDVFIGPKAEVSVTFNALK